MAHAAANLPQPVSAGLRLDDVWAWLGRRLITALDSPLRPW